MSSSNIQNSIILMDMPLLVRKLFDSSSSILAHLSFGNPKIPELIAGIEMLLNPESDKTSMRDIISSLIKLVP